MRPPLHNVWQHLQRQLFPVLVEELGELGEKDRLFVEVVSLLPLGRFLPQYNWCGVGCPPHERVWLLHAFIAKEVYQFATREALVDALKARPTLRRLCGWETVDEVPSPSTFCRAFAQFAADELPQQIHEALIKQHCRPKLVWHVSRDATAIQALERPAPRRAPSTILPTERRRVGRPKKGQEPPKAPPTRLELQPSRTLAENLADLPRICDSGCKKGSRGQPEYWQGYKLHLDVIEGDIPISAILTSARTHDSQVAIPLMQMSAQRVSSLYQLMDAAYDAEPIHAYVRWLGQVPISAQAVGWQIWTAPLTYLLPRFCAWLSQWGHSFARLFTLLRAGLWQRMQLRSLLETCGTAAGGGRFLGTPQQAFLAGFG